MNITLKGVPDDSMDWLQFISSVIGSLSWPLMIVVALWLFRRPISSLIDGIQEAKWGDGSLKIDRTLEDAEKSQEVALAELAGNVKVSGAIEVDHVVEDVDARFDRFFAVSPAMAVIDMWQQVESGLRALGARHAVDMDMKNKSANQVAYALKNQSVLPHSMLKWLYDMRQVRNLAAHKSDEISETDALRFKELGSKVLSILRQL